MPNDLGPDLARDVAQAQARLVPSPAGQPNGRVLAVTGPDDFAWQQPPEKQVLEGLGDPNGNVNAPKGTLYVERDAPALWQNDDGLSSWVPVGGAAATPPTAWVEWQVASAQGPYAWNGSEQEVLYSDPSDGMSHGAAITLTAGHAVAAVDGWFTLSGYANVESLGATTGYDGLRSRLLISRSFTLGGDGQEPIDNLQVFDVQTRAGTDQRAYVTFNWTGYLATGDTVRVFVHMQAQADPGDDWQVDSGLFYMEKLPL